MAMYIFVRSNIYFNITGIMLSLAKVVNRNASAHTKSAHLGLLAL